MKSLPYSLFKECPQSGRQSCKPGQKIKCQIFVHFNPKSVNWSDVRVCYFVFEIYNILYLTFRNEEVRINRTNRILASGGIEIELVQCRATLKGQSICQKGTLKNGNKSPAYDQVLLNLGIVNPGCKLTPGDNIRFGNHRSLSTSVLIRSRQLVSFPASPTGNDGSSLVKGGLLSAIKRAISSTSAAWPAFLEMSTENWPSAITEFWPPWAMFKVRDDEG